MLDTNICVFVIRGNSQVAALRLRKEIGVCGISIITLAELQYGVEKSQDPAKNRLALTKFVAPLELAEYDAVATEFYGQIRSDLEKRGLPIGPLDTLIAAHALRLNAILVTNNTREFSRVKGLQLDDWTIP